MAANLQTVQPGIELTDLNASRAPIGIAQQASQPPSNPSNQSIEPAPIQPPVTQPIAQPVPVPQQKPVVAPPAKPLVPPKAPADPSQTNAIFWKDLTIGFIILTCITIVILLQVLMFIKNCVPSSNGILLNSGISVTYFILSLFSLVFMFGVYETVSYGLQNVLWWTRIAVLVYGIILMLLGLLIFIIELQGLEASVEQNWKAMTEYQKDFFKRQMDQLTSERQQNTILTAIFTLLIGALFIIVSGFSFKLHEELKVPIVINRQSARMPVIEQFAQKVKFIGWFQPTTESYYQYSNLSAQNQKKAQERQDQSSKLDLEKQEDMRRYGQIHF